eukprot:COSAG06_NODE_28333_length_576_cov_1.052411_1_plen_143_part_00
MKTRDEAGDGLVKLITKLRTDAALNNRELVRRIVLDPAGEWSKKNTAFMDKMRQLNPPVEIEERATGTEKRLNARAESTMRVIEDMTKAIMADTRLTIEDFPMAVDHAVWTLNLVPMSKKISLLRHHCNKHHLFTKTGSGQT